MEWPCSPTWVHPDVVGGLFLGREGGGVADQPQRVTSERPTETFHDPVWSSVFRRFGRTARAAVAALGADPFDRERRSEREA